ncbi:MAG: DUF2600 family protein [Solirubrobacteraceae bacterium]
MLDATRSQALLAARFVEAACRYWLGTYPAIRREIRRLRRQAARIPDPTLRATATSTLDGKWGDLEGAGAFAAFAPRRSRTRVTRLLVCLQGIYDYADTLAEQPSDDPQADAIALHSALLDALRPGTPLGAYYAHHRHGRDGGYMASLVEQCRLAIAQLPAYTLVAEVARQHAQRIVDYQARINHEPDHQYAEFAAWAKTETPEGTGLYWWETGAACGSSLALLALLAAAADPKLTEADAGAVDAIYWPWAGALHTLLDNLIDRAEDAGTSQHNLTHHYTDAIETSERLGLLTVESIKRFTNAPPHHRLILAGMIALYLSDEQAQTAFARPVSEEVLSTIDGLARPSLLLLRVRRLLFKSYPAKQQAR